MIDALIRASIGGAVAVAVVWTIGRLAPRLSPAVRTTLWWLAAAKFLVSLVWMSPLEIPVLPAAPPAIVQAGTLPVMTTEGGRYAAAPAESSAQPLNLEVLAVSLWAAGAIIAIALGVWQWRRASAIVHASRPVSDHLNALASDLAGRLGIARVPAIRESDLVDTPLVSGFRRPTVIVPAPSFHLLSLDQQRMALCHELAHVKRADLSLGVVPALAERVFFFHPLVHIASREYSIWREAACDRDVLDALDAAPAEYGQLLVDLGVSRPRAGLAAAGASSSFTSLKRRLTMLTESPNRSRYSRVIAFSAIGVAALTLVPLTLAARSAPVSEAAIPLLEQVVEKPKPLEEPKRDRSAVLNELGRLHRESAVRLVMFTGGDNTLLRGEPSDVTHATRLRAGDEKLLWFRLDEAEYVARSADALKQFMDMWDKSNVTTITYKVAPEGPRKIKSEVSEEKPELHYATKTELGLNMTEVETLLRRFVENGAAGRIK